LSEADYPDLYEGSEGKLDQIARDLEEDEDGSIQDPEDAASHPPDDDNEDPPEDAPGPSIQHPHNMTEQVPGISSLVLLILQVGFPAWTAEKGKKRRKVWKDILSQLRDLPENRGLLQSQWVLRGEVSDRKTSMIAAKILT
jgi:hypothetical protein